MRIEHDQAKHMFAIFNDQGEEMGQIGYVVLNEKEIDANRTQVYPAYEGQGIAGKLLEALVDYAAENSMKILTSCSYVEKAFKKYPDRYQKVIKN